MKEKDLTNKILKKLNTIPHSYWYKIPDPTRCPKCGTIAVVSRRPFDIIGTVERRSIAIEVKVRSLKDLTPHQVAHLRMHAMAKGEAYVMVWDDQVYDVDSFGCYGPCAKDLISFVEYLQSL